MRLLSPSGLRLLAVLIAAAATAAGALGQSSPDCPVRPPTLAAMTHCYRPLLVFAPSPKDARLAAQQAALDRAADDMMDRNVLLVPIFATVAGPPATPAFTPPLDAPWDLLPPPEQASLRRRFHVPPPAFVVVLIGEDGSPKLRSDRVLSVDRLNSLIDAMPMRKLEMQKPHTN